MEETDALAGSTTSVGLVSAHPARMTIGRRTPAQRLEMCMPYS
jgi:hypothetical protein